MHGEKAVTHVSPSRGVGIGEIRISMRRDCKKEKLEGRHNKGMGLHRTLLGNEAACIILDPFGLP
jgi:hypothetical protein